MRAHLLWAMLLLGCGSGPRAPQVVLTPSKASSFGQLRVTAQGKDLTGLGTPLTVTVGGINAYLVTRDAPDAVSFVVQGAPDPGPAKVVIANRTQSVEAGSFEYLPPADPSLKRLVAFGASLTEGAQSASISVHGQTHGFGAAFARATGAYLSLPLVHDEDMPGLVPDDFDQATCLPKSDLLGIIQQRGVSEILPKISDDVNGIVIARVRVDPNLEVRNVAVGGVKLAQTLHGASDLPLTIMEHITWDARATESQLFYEPKDTMLDRVQALQPTMLVSTDLYANDFVTLDLSDAGVPNVDSLTTPAALGQDLADVLTRLDQTGAEVFLANGPDPSFMQQYQDKVKQLEDSGLSTADATAWLTDLRTRIQAYNAELARQAPMHPHVHVVDLFSKVEDLKANGVQAGGHTLKPVRFGGLLSFDGEHFSDTGYALTANLFVDAVNAWLGHQAIQHLDLDAVYADDPYSIEHLQALGFTCAGTQ